MPQAIHISPIDNVVVALHPIAKGTLVEVDGLAVTALEDIPQAVSYTHLTPALCWALTWQASTSCGTACTTTPSAAL